MDFYEVGDTPPKFNSEFTTEKWWLEDHPFLLGQCIFSGSKGTELASFKRMRDKTKRIFKTPKIQTPNGSKIKKSCRFPGFSSKRCLGHPNLQTWNPNLQAWIRVSISTLFQKYQSRDVSCYQPHLLSEAASPIKMTYSSQAGGGTKFGYEKDSTDLEPAWSNHPDFETCLPML